MTLLEPSYEFLLIWHYRILKLGESRRADAARYVDSMTVDQKSKNKLVGRCYIKCGISDFTPKGAAKA